MASGTSDLIVRLSLDTTQFEGSLSKFEGQMTKLQASCTNATTGITNFKQVTAKLQTSAQTLTDTAGSSGDATPNTAVRPTGAKRRTSRRKKSKQRSSE